MPASLAEPCMLPRTLIHIKSAASKNDRVRVVAGQGKSGPHRFNIPSIAAAAVRSRSAASPHITAPAPC
ncbi:hypothetical protein V496_04876 [Pseudogymnoascus sp. VKM F-4515 (FW-2607)]|nr:hypothetical protein V496_04876 [Pseudogymnoascus sp. VKM F-4515 (FW-2607)]